MFAEVKDAMIVNIDNFNTHYDVSLKDYSLAQLKVDHHFVKGDIADCQEHGLLAPEFIQAKDLVRLYGERKKQQSRAKK